MPRLELKEEKANEYLLQKAKIEKKKVTLEIGFGAGENILHMLHKEQESLFLGCEPFLTGVANFLSKLEEKDFRRVKLFCGDAMVILNTISPDIFSRIIILFPDPWPKTKHHKRRIINQTNLELFSKSLVRGGIIYAATDIREYFYEIRDNFKKNKKYIIVNRDNFTHKPSELGKSKYEVKAINNLRIPHYLVAQKTSG